VSTMLRVTSALMLLAALACMIALAQAPYRDDYRIGPQTNPGPVIPNASISITNKATGVSRTASSAADGNYSATAPSGRPTTRVRSEVQGFRTVVREGIGCEAG